MVEVKVGGDGENGGSCDQQGRAQTRSHCSICTRHTQRLNAVRPQTGEREASALHGSPFRSSPFYAT